MGFIRKSAIKSYKRELSAFNSMIEDVDDRELADLFVFGLWTRAGMQVEGSISLPGNEPYLMPELVAYPILQGQFQGIMKAFQKKGLIREGNSMLFWIFSCRALLYREELKDEINFMWSRVLETKAHWDELLTDIEEENTEIDRDTRIKTLKLALEIQVHVEDDYSPFIK
ncbi:hypothetical protein KC960_04985 [Candidatus Saccharibacteria bacterium]|nr:hypothetical protein [Candidatus Saccharibacteria bacterium]